MWFCILTVLSLLWELLKFLPAELRLPNKLLLWKLLNLLSWKLLKLLLINKLLLVDKLLLLGELLKLLLRKLLKLLLTYKI